MDLGILAVFGAYLGCWLGTGREKSLVGGSGHGVGDIEDVVFLLGGDVKVQPIPLLPMWPDKNLKSFDWAAVMF
jgi:hypothetical protein